MSVDQDRRHLIAAFLAHRAALERYLYRCLGDWPLAEDMAQDTLVKLLAYRGGPIRLPKSPIFTTAKHLLIDRQRKASTAIAYNMMDIDALDIAASGPTPEEHMLVREDLSLVLDRINQLPPQQRRVLTLRRIEGLSRAEAAAELKISINTLHKHLTKALKAISEG